MQIDFCKFSRKANICNIPENHLNAWLFSNPCGQALKSRKSRGQICPIVIRRKRIIPCELEDNNACKWILDYFPGIIHMSEFLENCQNLICMHGCSPIGVERSQSLLEFHGVRMCQCNIWVFLVKGGQFERKKFASYKTLIFFYCRVKTKKSMYRPSR